MLLRDFFLQNTGLCYPSCLVHGMYHQPDSALCCSVGVRSAGKNDCQLTGNECSQTGPQNYSLLCKGTSGTPRKCWVQLMAS